MERTAYLGPEGSYSHLAAKNLRAKSVLVPFGNFRAVVEAVQSGECDNGVIPIENTVNGGVLQNIDLLQNSQNVIAAEELTLPIDHRLATAAGANYGGISRIYSHEQPLAQCAEFLYSNFPKAELIAVKSTAASLEYIKSAGDAAIVGAHMRREGIELSKENIADGKNNFTHFLLIKRGCADGEKPSSKIYFSLTCNHRAGALSEILRRVCGGGLNMTKIQSRPIKDCAGEYRFFIEVEGDYSSKEVQKVLNDVKSAANYFKILGAY